MEYAVIAPPARQDDHDRVLGAAVYAQVLSQAAPFRRQLSGFYAAWKDRLGTKCWSLLEAAAGSSLA